MASILKFPRRRAGRARRPAADAMMDEGLALDFMQAARQAETEQSEAERTNVVALEDYRIAARLGR